MTPFLHQPAYRPEYSLGKRLGIAAVASLIAALITWVLWNAVFDEVPFALFFAAVAVSAWFGGLQNALLVALIGIIECGVLLSRESRPIGMPLTVLFGVSIVIGWLAEQRIRTLAENRANQQRLQLLADNAPVLIWNVDPRGRLTFVNRPLLDFAGRAHNDLLGTAWTTLIDARDCPTFEPAFASAVNAGQPLSKQLRLRGVLSSDRWFHISLVPQFTPSRELTGYIGSAADITEMKQAEEARREAEARFHLLADAAPVKVWVAGPDRAATWFNQRWLKFRGRTLEQELGFGWLEGVHPEDRQRCLDTYTQAFASRQPFMLEFRLLRHDGEYRWLINQGAPAENNSVFEGFIGSCLDITDRKLSEQQRDLLLVSEKEAREAAERASRLKDEFLSTVSHEVRTPLNAILGYAQMLSAGMLDEAETREAAEIIERNSRVQAQIIEDLLDMSRIISGKVRLDVQTVHLADVIEAALDTVRPSAQAKDLRLQTVLDPKAGPVRGDANRLQQVVWNLLSNAVKFTPKGGRIQIALERVNSHVEISVSDSGEGIAPEFLPYVFDRFRQGEATTTRRHGGLGLGLAIVKHLVELHGGTVRAKSPGPGEGATFSVALPLLIVHPGGNGDGDRVHPTASASKGTDCEEVDLTSVKLLVVDDEPDARSLVKRLLEQCHATVALAGNATEALRQFDGGRFDLLISDIGMPGQDGYELIREIRRRETARDRKTPAIALTAFARSEDRRRAMLAGYQSHIAKPVEPSELIAAVATLLGRTGGQPVA
jgi:PAS domain S-box-containing protein